VETYYKGWHARFYNMLWRTYTVRTLHAVVALFDFASLHQIAEELGCELDPLLRRLRTLELAR
jgi:hypothetical protein